MWPTPASIISRGPRPVTSRPSMMIWPLSDVPQPGDGLDQLALAVGVDAGEADDLARAHLEVDAAHGGQPAVVDHVQVAHLEHRLARRVLGLLDPQQHVAADHQRGQAALGRALGRHRVDLLAAPQDRHAVGDVEHLVELVRDEDDRRAVLRSVRSTRNRSCDSCAVSTAVGSSSTSTLAPRNSARRISTRCWAPTPRSSTLASGRTASPYCSLSSRVRRRRLLVVEPARRGGAARSPAPGSRPRSSPGRA